jgi:hypothetical protein
MNLNKRDNFYEGYYAKIMQYLKWFFEKEEIGLISNT